MTGTSIRDRVRDVLRLAEADPGRSVPLATALARQARAGGDLASASVAERALGLAALHLKDPDAAMRHLRTAVALGQRAGSTRLAAQAQMRLAFALNVRGRPRQAVREIDAVLADLDGVERAQAQAQRGAILHQLGRLDEALASYRTALPVLRRAHDDVWIKRVLSNRGVLHGQRHEFAAAETDLTEAEQLCRKLDQGLTLAFIQQNLGWVSGRRGDVPRALAYLDQAEQRLRGLRSQLGWVLRDRSELLLSVGLAAEAKQAAQESVAAFERERRVIALPEVRLLLAQAAALDGDPAGAATQARRAAREFARQHRQEWAALGRFVVLAARAAAQPPSVPVAQVERAAELLDHAGWPDAAVEARLLAGRLALARGWTARGCRQLAQASRLRRRGPATLRARAWHAEALARLAAGNARGAKAAVRAGLRVLDEHRATLGATDLRAHAAGHRVELADLGLRMALRDGRPDRVLAAAEQGRASHLLLRPVRPPDDPALAGDLASLRATVAEVEELRRAGRNTVRLAQRQIALERRIRDYCRRQPGTPLAGPPDGPVPLRRLSAALGDRVLVEFVQHGEVLYAITVVDGRARLHTLGSLPPIRRLLERVPFALHRLARRWATGDSRAAAQAMLRHAARQLDTALLRPLATEIGDWPLVLIPTGPLQSLPWGVLPSCAGRALTVSPSAALWYGARSTGPVGPVSVVAGPDLPGARAEVDAVAAIHGTAALAGPAATVAATTAALNGAGLAHLAAHGSVHPDHPLFSALLLADGPLTGYDLERLDRVPRMVILAACDSGRLVVRAGDELLGLAATLLASGAQQIVASVVPVPDAQTAPLMVALHRQLVAGRPATAALAAAQQEVAGTGPEAMAAAAGFVCLGAEFTLPSGR